MKDTEGNQPLVINTDSKPSIYKIWRELEEPIRSAKRLGNGIVREIIELITYLMHQQRFK